MQFSYKMRGTCARQVNFEIDDSGRIKNTIFEGGCNGNAKGIASLAENRTPREIIDALEGIKCGFKNTSCPDQFAKALKSTLE